MLSKLVIKQTHEKSFARLMKRPCSTISSYEKIWTQEDFCWTLTKNLDCVILVYMEPILD